VFPVLHLVMHINLQIKHTKLNAIKTHSRLQFCFKNVKYPMVLKASAQRLGTVCCVKSRRGY